MGNVNIKTEGTFDLRGWRLALAGLALLLLAAYLLVYAGRFHVIDEVSLYSMSESLAKRGSLDTDQLLWSQWVREPREVQGDFSPDGTVYSKRGFGTAILPALFIRLGMLRDAWGLTYAALYTNALITALTAVLLAAYVRRLGARPATGIALGLVYGLATIAMPYARTLFGEPVSALLLLGTAYCLLRSTDEKGMAWAALAGVILSLALWVRLLSALALAPFVIFLLMRRTSWRQIAAFLSVTALLGLGGNAWYNFYRFGSPLTSGYQFGQGESFITPVWVGLYGLLFSPFRGLFWFSPILLAAIPGTVASWRRDRAATLMAVGVVLVYLIPFSAWWMWWGGFAWGPRFLLPVVPFMVALTAPLWDMPRPRRVLIALVLVSLVVQFLAVASDFTLSEMVLENTFGHPEQSAAMWNPAWSPIVLQARHLLEGFWDVAWVAVGRQGLPVILATLLAVAAGVLALLWSRRDRRLASGAIIAGVILLLVGYGAGLSTISSHAAAQPFDSQVRKAIAVIEREAAPGDTVVTLAPYDYVSIMNWLHAPLRVIGLAPHAAPLREQEGQQLTRAVRDAKERVWLIAPRIPPGDEATYAERWLSEHGFVAHQQWYGDTRLLAFAPAPDTAGETRDGAEFEGGITLDSVKLHDEELLRGRDLRVETVWHASEPVPTDYTIFVHLLASDGSVASGQDGPPVNSYRPSTSWQPGETIMDRKGVPIPADLSPGEYALEIGLYDPATGQRVRLANGEDRVLVTGLKARQ